MFVRAEDIHKLLTLGEFRRLTKKLPNSAIIACEDGNYAQSIAERAMTARYISIAGDDGERFLGQRQLKQYWNDHSPSAVLALKTPVVLIEYTSPVPPKQESKE